MTEDVPATRRESPANDPGRTRRDGAEETTNFTDRLPPALSRRFTVTRQFPVQGAEADIFLAAGEHDRQVVIKLYRYGIEVDRTVAELLPSLTGELEHCVTVEQVGVADGRHFEVQEYLPLGALTITEPWPTDEIRGFALQMAVTLRELHSAGVVHRDLKPENLLLRRTAPLEVAITDFGISRHMEMTAVFTGMAGSFAYAPPEAATPQARVSAAWDWWALGMVIRALATGRAPDEGVSEAVFLTSLVSRTVDLSMVEDRNIRRLCQGLLTRDPDHRWTADQVTAWARGESPAVLDTFSGGRPGIEFGGGVHDDPVSLADAIASNWDAAAQWFFGRMGSEDNPGEAWSRLRDWLGEHAEPERREALGELIYRRLRSSDPHRIKVLHLLIWLDPSRPPEYRGYEMTRPVLVKLARIAIDERHSSHTKARGVITDLHRYGLLRHLATMPGGEGLKRVDAGWSHVVRKWHWRTDDAGPLAWLLWIAIQPNDAGRRLRRELGRLDLPMEIGWFKALIRDDEPGALLKALYHVEEARSEVAERRRVQEVGPPPVYSSPVERYGYSYEPDRRPDLSAMEKVENFFRVVGMALLVAFWVAVGAVILWIISVVFSIIGAIADFFDSIF